MTEQTAGKALTAAAVLAGLLTVALFLATVVFGYLACFRNGVQGDHYFNAAFFSFMLAGLTGLATFALVAVSAS